MNYKRALIIAPHPDDEVLGAGGLIKKLTKNGCEVIVVTVSGHLPPLYKKKDYEVTVAEAKNAHKLLDVSSSIYWEIPATMISDMPIHELNGKFHQFINDFRPQLVLSPYPDRHIDHRLIFDAVMVATRPVSAGKEICLLAAYETLSETHWNAPHIECNFIPNWIVDISDTINQKIKALRCFKSQISPFPAPRSAGAVKALAKFRGSQSGFSFGEAFHIIRKIS